MILNLSKIIKEIEYRLQDKRIKISLSDSAKDFIVNQSFDEAYGARPIKRYVSKTVETMLANDIIQDKIKMDDNIIVDVDNDHLVLKKKN